jgi:hypothetical protein
VSAPSTSQAGSPSSPWAAGRAFAIGALLVTALTAPTVTRLTTVGRLDTSDGRFSIWNVAWIGHALRTDPTALLNTNIFWPYEGTLAYSELNLVAGLFGLPWYLATGSPLAALNGAVAVGLLLAFVCMWALVRRLTGSDPAGLVSAVAFTFCPYVSAHTAHIQLLMVFAFPLVLLSYHRLADRPGVWRGLELGAALTAAALACGYYGLFAGLALGFVAVLLARRSMQYWSALGCAALTAGALVAPVYVAFTRARLESGAVLVAPGTEAANWSANAASYLSSGAAAHAWWLPALSTWQPRGDVLFPGIGVIVLAGAGIALFGRIANARMVWTYAGLALVAGWVSLGPSGGLYSAVALLPGMSMVRAPARLGIVVAFALAVLAGYGAAYMAARRRWIVAALVVMLAAELGAKPAGWGWPSLRSVPPVPIAYQRLSQMARAPLVVFPFPYVSTDFHNHSWAMFWSTYHWLPIVNGYSDVIPPGFRSIALPINGFPDPASFAIMREREVRYVVWHRDRYNTAARAVLDERLRHYAEYLRPIVRSEEEWLFEIVRYPERQGN